MEPQTLETLAPGTVFHRYRIVGTRGHGGMAAVYEAVESNGTRVALKVMHTTLARNAEARARFRREGEAASRVRHPHVVDVTEVGTHDGRPYLVMELLDGQDLESCLRRNGPMPPDAAADVMLPVISAVAALHDAGIVHRDLKPGNVFLARRPDGGMRPVLLDFGVSRIASRGPVQLVTGGDGSLLLGTPYYMSPEQAGGDPTDVDARTDQYSLGVMLYECLAGRGPFDDLGMYATLYAIVQGEFAAPSVHRPGLAPVLDALVLRAMAREPGDRFVSVSDLGRTLVPFASVGVQSSWEEVFGRTTLPFGTRRPRAQVLAVGGTFVDDTLEDDPVDSGVHPLLAVDRSRSG